MEHAPSKPELNAIRIEQPVLEDAEAIADVQGRTWIATYPNAEIGITRKEIIERIEGRREKAVEGWRKTIAENGNAKQLLVAKDRNGSVLGFSLA